MTGYQKKKKYGKNIILALHLFQKKIKNTIIYYKKTKTKRYSKFFYEADLEYPSNSNLDTWL